MNPEFEFTHFGFQTNSEVRPVPDMKVMDCGRCLVCDLA